MNGVMLGKTLMIVGASILLLGVLLYFFHEQLSWIGRLPGDLRVEKKNLKVFFPVTTMLLLSVLLSVISYLYGRFLK